MHEATPAPPFHFEIEERGDTACVYCHGRLVASAGLDKLFYVPVSQLLPTHKHLILDLSGLTHMDSMGLGAFVRIYVSAKSKGCTLELRHLGQKIRELLIMTNLLPAFTVTGERGIRM